MSTLVGFETVECSNCGIVFGLSGSYRQTRVADHVVFYCPNGHSQFYPAETEAEKLRRQLKAEQDYANGLNRQLTDERNGHRATKGVVTKLRKRAITGTCAFCRRHFANVERHVATKHPSETP